MFVSAVGDSNSELPAGRDTMTNQISQSYKGHSLKSLFIFPSALLAYPPCIDHHQYIHSAAVFTYAKEHCMVEVMVELVQVRP